MRTLVQLPSRCRAAGVGLVTAIFLLVVLAGLGVAAVTIFNAQQASASLDMDGARAYQAARAGIEWGLFQQRRRDQCANASFGFNDSVLANFTVTVTCRAIGGLTDSSGNPSSLVRFRITATACNQPVGGECRGEPSNSPDFVQRRLEVEI